MAAPRRDISITLNDAQRKAVQQMLVGIKNGLERAMPPAINRTISTGRTRIVRRIGNEIALRAKTIREAFTLGKASRAKPVGLIRIRRKPVPLVEFNPRQTLAGVTVKVRKKEARQLLRSTFLGVMASGHEGVFERRREGPGRVPRLPIDERMGPTVLGVFEGAPGVAADELAQLGEVLEKNVLSQVDRLLARRRA
jgi:hypothetical protein